MEMAMRHHLFVPAFAVTVVAGACSANAQTVIAQEGVVTVPTTAVVTQPVAAAPVETIETVRTVQSITSPRHRHVSRHSRDRTVRRVTTTRTIVRERVAPAVAAVPRPVATAVVAAPAPAAPLAYPAPLYDVVPAAPAVAAPIVQPVAAAPVAIGMPVPAYRYVYQPDRILVIDANTGIAVQALPR
jgi:hypothetical protein